MTRLRRIARPGSLIFILSDFRAFNDECKTELVRLTGHTGIALIAIHDPLEAEFPRVIDAAAISDDHRTVSPAGVSAQQRADYADQFTRRLDAVKQHCLDHRLLYTTLETSADPVKTLVKFLGG
jgi:hypothetical protein